MKNTLLFVLVLSISIVIAGEKKQFGEKLTLSDTTRIATILETPQDFLDKRVLVKGTVIDVCQHQGCWIRISDEADSVDIIAKVEDGVIVFPAEASGKMAVVEGKVEKIEYSMEKTLEMEKHECELEGKEFDASQVTQPKVTYRIWAYGAQIEM